MMNTTKQTGVCVQGLSGHKSSNKDEKCQNKGTQHMIWCSQGGSIIHKRNGTSHQTGFINLNLQLMLTKSDL
jgi:hypothetical protein